MASTIKRRKPPNLTLTIPTNNKVLNTITSQNIINSISNHSQFDSKFDSNFVGLNLEYLKNYEIKEQISNCLKQSDLMLGKISRECGGSRIKVIGTEDSHFLAHNNNPENFVEKYNEIENIIPQIYTFVKYNKKSKTGKDIFLYIMENKTDMKSYTEILNDKENLIDADIKSLFDNGLILMDKLRKIGFTQNDPNMGNFIAKKKKDYTLENTRIIDIDTFEYIGENNKYITNMLRYMRYFQELTKKLNFYELLKLDENEKKLVEELDLTKVEEISLNNDSINTKVNKYIESYNTTNPIKTGGYKKQKKMNTKKMTTKKMNTKKMTKKKMNIKKRNTRNTRNTRKK